MQRGRSDLPKVTELVRGHSRASGWHHVPMLLVIVSARCPMGIYHIKAFGCCLEV